MSFAGNLQQMFVLHLFYFSLLKTIVLFLKTLPLHCKHFYFKTKCWSPLHPILLMDYLLKIAFKSKICSGLDKWLVAESQVVKKTGRGIFPLAVRGRKSSIQVYVIECRTSLFPMPPFGRGYLFHIEQLNAKISSTWHLKSWWSLLNSNYIHYYNQRIISIFLFDMTISDLKIIKYSVCTFSTLKVFPFFWCPRPRKLHNSCHDTPESAQPDKTQIIKIIYLYEIYDADSQ